MVDIETFLVYLFVLADDFCKAHPLPSRPGPEWKPSASEAITLLLFGQWARFRGEQDFYRFADQKLRNAFPNLPTRPQLNRLRTIADSVASWSRQLYLTWAWKSKRARKLTAVVTLLFCVAMGLFTNMALEQVLINSRDHLRFH